MYVLDRTKGRFFSKPQLSHQACVGWIDLQLGLRGVLAVLWPAEFGHQRRSHTGCILEHLGVDARVLRVRDKELRQGLAWRRIPVHHRASGQTIGGCLVLMPHVWLPPSVHNGARAGLLEAGAMAAPWHVAMHEIECSRGPVHRI